MKNLKLEITKNALNKFNKLLFENNNKKILLYIEKKGCHGYSYNLKLIYNKINNNNLIKIDYKTLKLYIINKDINIIQNLKIDYIKEDFNYKFIFINNNYKNVCGCGKSFNILKN